MTRSVHYLWLAVGFGLWATALSLIYGLHAVGCAYDWPPAALRVMIGAITLAHLVLLALLWRHWRHEGSFLGTLARWSLAAALVATAFSYLPLLFLTTCIP
ncbi:hypothetical protein ACFQXB_13925 [Plastorhodobacter daqingensis]|uniref:Uncharacterized protein n=1 Tax=Plastorhodobacter daqingensis TaxID=1387281 RepID=A0ABW2UKR0_9RHOB